MAQSERITKSIRHKRKLNQLFVGAIVFVELLLFAIVIVVASFTNNGNVYSHIALLLMLIWIGILVGYYAWAIYFYNINLGLTNQDWAEIRDRKENAPEATSSEPTYNPNAEQTLGLPPGTLRGTIALTLLVGGIAMAIASLGMDETAKADSIIVDHFDFFKTAFLMMIAFYFGNKALETLGYKSSGGILSGTQTSTTAKPPTPNVQSPAPVSTTTPGDIKNTLKQGVVTDTTKEEDDDFENPNAAQ